MTSHRTEKIERQKAEHRTLIIQGQIAGLLRAMEQEDCCLDLLRRSLVIQASLKSLDAFFLERYLKSNAKKIYGGEKGKTVAKIMKVCSQYD